MGSDTRRRTFDTGQEYLGTVYAKALLGAAEKAGTTAQVLAELDSFVQDVLDKLPKFEAALVSPRVPFESKLRMLDQSLAGRASPILVNFLKVVGRHERLNCLRAVQRGARRLHNEMRGYVEVVVRTAEPVPADLSRQMADGLAKKLDRGVDLTAEVDPQLIGGAVVRVADTVFDGSIANRLARMRKTTLERTAARIREALDRFASAQ